MKNESPSKDKYNLRFSDILWKADWFLEIITCDKVYSKVPLYYLSAECGNINPWFSTGKMFGDGRNHLQCPCWGWKSRQNMSQPGGERITQTITKRSIIPIGPGQTLRSNALAKNNRNNDASDSIVITVYRGPIFFYKNPRKTSAVWLEINVYPYILFGRFSSLHLFRAFLFLCRAAVLYKISLSPRWIDLCDGSIGTSAGIFKQSMGARNRGGIGLL